MIGGVHSQGEARLGPSPRPAPNPGLHTDPNLRPLDRPHLVEIDVARPLLDVARQQQAHEVRCLLASAVVRRVTVERTIRVDGVRVPDYGEWVAYVVSGGGDGSRSGGWWPAVVASGGGGVVIECRCLTHQRWMCS